MIFFRKPNSDERQFNEDIHICEKIGDMHAVWRSDPLIIRAHFQLGKEGGTKFTDCAIDFTWADVIQLIKIFAEKGGIKP